MQRKTRSLLEELESIGHSRDRKHLIESRAANVIASAIFLLEQIHRDFSPEQAELLERRLLASIKNRDDSKFRKTLRANHDKKTS